MKYLIISFLLLSSNISSAFDASKFLGGGSTQNNATPDTFTQADKAQIDNLVKSFNGLTLNQKEKLIEFRRAYKEALEDLMIQFETLPKEVKEVLKLEKTVKQSLSPKGKEELDKYTNKNDNNGQ